MLKMFPEMIYKDFIKKKIRVGILFGGMSAEHEISIKSAESIHKNIDKDKFLPILIYINKNGLWSIIDEKKFLNKEFNVKNCNSFIPWQNNHAILESKIDIYFPILHGPNGEDGKIQGIFELARQPYVGANSLSSALAMDKVVSKTLFKNIKLLTPDFLFFTENNLSHIKNIVLDKIDYPIFVKPCSLGSSVGISKVERENDLKKALDSAFVYDKKIIIEKAINAREIEISVMGNKGIKVSKPGELIPYKEFYDYEDKYVVGKTQFNIPVELDPQIEKKIVEIAERAYKSHFLNGMARIDFFLEKNTNTIYINEINTIPGFTEISMFPKLWEVEGITFTDLITQLIEYGFEYFENQIHNK